MHPAVARKLDISDLEKEFIAICIIPTYNVGSSNTPNLHVSRDLWKPPLRYPVTESRTHNYFQEEVRHFSSVAREEPQSGTMSSFFTKPKSENKRKRSDTNELPKKRFAPSKTSRESRSATAPRPRKPQRDESISGSDDESDEAHRDESAERDLDQSSSEDDGEETAAEKRLRLAERYLENTRQDIVDEIGGFDAAQIDRDLLAERLEEDSAESKGKLYRKLADGLSFEAGSHTTFKCNTQTFTSAATCPPYAYTVSKDLCLIKWLIQEYVRSLLDRFGPAYLRALPNRHNYNSNQSSVYPRINTSGKKPSQDKHLQGESLFKLYVQMFFLD